jgi:hypothetical protein
MQTHEQHGHTPNRRFLQAPSRRSFLGMAASLLAPNGWLSVLANTGPMPARMTWTHSELLEVPVAVPAGWRMWHKYHTDGTTPSMFVDHMVHGEASGARFAVNVCRLGLKRPVLGLCAEIAEACKEGMPLLDSWSFPDEQYPAFGYIRTNPETANQREFFEIVGNQRTTTFHFVEFECPDHLIDELWPLGMELVRIQSLNPNVLIRSIIPDGSREQDCSIF